jgi:predicted RNase H-like nuclease
MRVLGIDLAWADSTATAQANETGVVAVDPDGSIVDAGWTVGIDETIAWMLDHAADDALAMIDAPLVVTNLSGQRLCEKQVGQRYGRWKVSANSTNLSSNRLGGVTLRQRLEELGWQYCSGHGGPPTAGRSVSECYPYTALVGAQEFGYDDERPVYKRKPKKMKTAPFRVQRAVVADDLIRRLDRLGTANPPLQLRSHPATESLLTDPTPIDDPSYKHREDLIDAVLCAWTGLLWLQHGTDRCQILGDDDSDLPATIIAPARSSQRRPAS